MQIVVCYLIILKALFTAGDSADAGSAGKGAGKLAKSAYKALEAELKLALTSLKEQQKGVRFCI